MFQVLDVLAAVRRSTPLVHCMTNTVVPEITANVLLAAGAAPAMIDLPEEAQIFAGVASPATGWVNTVQWVRPVACALAKRPSWWSVAAS